jgi:transposase-like protein
MSRQSKRPRRSPAEIAQILEAFDRSGVSAARFAAEHEISVSTFRSWLVRRREENALPATVSRLVSVELADGAPAVEPTIEVMLGNGRQVRIGAGFDPDALAAVLAVIDGAC